MARSSRFLIPALLVLFLAPAKAVAQAGQNGRQRADAVRVPDGAIRIDGRLDDADWQNAPPLTDFVQKEPE